MVNGVCVLHCLHCTADGSLILGWDSSNGEGHECGDGKVDPCYPTCRDRPRTEKSERGDLIRMMRRVQSAALQKYDPDPALRPQLAGYYIGTNLARNHANLAQYSASLLQSVQSDPLPGITADAISALRDTRQAWIDTNANQAQASQRSGQHYQEATTLLASLRSVRLGMQHAIDGQFPYDEGESGTARASFHLPVTRPFRTPTRR